MHGNVSTAIALRRCIGRMPIRIVRRNVALRSNRSPSHSDLNYLPALRVMTVTDWTVWGPISISSVSAFGTIPSYLSIGITA